MGGIMNRDPRPRKALPAAMARADTNLRRITAISLRRHYVI